MFQEKTENLWFKLFLVILAICGFLIISGYLYYRNSSCLGNVWNCFEFEIIMLGGGILLFSLPLAVILFLWELTKKIREKKQIREQTAPANTNIPEPVRREAMKAFVPEEEAGPKDKLSKAVKKYIDNK